ncbi:MAG: GtrA family protein [Magnetococcales bacterium]|nr:GtrA family protein [Magnetococcales bacterium]
MTDMNTIKKAELSATQDQSHLLKQMVRYGIAGVLGATLHTGILVLLVQWLDLNPTLSTTVGFIVTVVVTFHINKHWTFDTREIASTALYRYVIISCIGLALNAGCMHLTTITFNLHYLIGQGIVIVLIPINNFILNYYWTFKPTPSPSAQSRY